MLMTTLDARHPVIAAALVLHEADPEEIQAILDRNGPEIAFDAKAGSPDLPLVRCATERCWVRWTQGITLTFYLTSPDFRRRGEGYPLQMIETQGLEIPESVLATLPGRLVTDLVELPGAGDLRIADARSGVSGPVFTLQPHYEIR